MENGHNFSIENFKKRLLKKFKYSNLFRNKIGYPEKKFLIYTRGRTGSTVLTDLLNCHPDIFCDVEIFNFIYSKSKVKFPLLYIDSCSKRAGLFGKSIYGFKVKISQLRFEDNYKNYESILNTLHTNGWKFIYLRRLNYLKHKLSNLWTSETNTYHTKGEKNIVQKKIKVDCNILLKGIIYSEEVQRTEAENLKNIEHLSLVYEKDILDNSKLQETSEKIFNFLDLKPYPVQTKYKKLISENLEDIILNFDEVYNFFKNTKYIEYFSKH